MDGASFLATVRPSLEAGDAAQLAADVKRHYSLRDVCGLLGHADTDVRRVAALVAGLVGDAGVVPCLTRALRDADPHVNEMAEHGLWAIWFRGGNPEAVKPFREGLSLLAIEAYPEAVKKFQQASRIDPRYAEAFNQCAIAHFFMGRWHDSLHDCRRTLALMPMHFGAMAGMGHCHAQMGDLMRALECYRRALGINPRMHAISRAVTNLEACLGDQNDSSGTYSIDPIPA